MDQNFPRHHKLHLIPLKHPHELEVIDGQPVASGRTTHVTKARLQIRHHVEDAVFFITQLGHYPVVLGIPWRQYHDVTIRYSQNRITFDSERFCRHHNAYGRPTWIKGLDFIPEKPRPNRMAFIGSTGLLHHVKRGLEVFSVTMRDIDTATRLGRTHRTLHAAAAKMDKDVKTLVPEHFHDFLHVFEKGKAQKLPPHRSYDHSMPLRPDSTPPFGPLYGMSHKELIVLKEYIEENLSKGFIRHSSSPAGAPVLFVKKADGSLRFCVDYRGLNEMTIKNRHPLPLIQKTLARLQKAKWYTKLDLRVATTTSALPKGRSGRQHSGRDTAILNTRSCHLASPTPPAVSSTS